MSEVITRVPPDLGPADKLQFTKTPEALPGSCIVCRQSANGIVRFLDFGMSIDYYGAVYFCEPCLIPLAHALGFLEVRLVQDAEREVAELRFELETQGYELERYRTIVNSLRSVNPDILNDVHVMENSKPNDSESTDNSEVKRDDDNGLVESLAGGGSKSVPQPEHKTG